MTYHTCITFHGADYCLDAAYDPSFANFEFGAQSVDLKIAARIAALFREEGMKGLTLRLKRRVWLQSTDYRTNLAKLRMDETTPFLLREMSAETLVEMRQTYPDELPEWKFKILMARLHEGTSGQLFYVEDAGQICGYFHLSFGDVYDSFLDHTHRVGVGEAHLFDDYTFQGHRRKGVHGFSIVARAILARERGCDTASVNIYNGNLPSERAYRSAGFLPSEFLTTFRCPLFKKTWAGRRTDWVMAGRTLLRRIIADTLARFIIAGGALRRAVARAERDRLITCIYFHNPDRKLFQECLRWLRSQGFQFLSSAELASIIEGESAWPSGKAVHVSLDDGWLSNKEEVVPVAEEGRFPITLFLSTGPILDGDFWWSYCRYDGHRPQDYKRVPEAVRKQWTLAGRAAFAPGRCALRLEDVKAIALADGMVTLGGHSDQHALASKCTDAELREEIENSTKLLEAWTGRKPVYFSYPDGNVDGRLLPMLEAFGYRLAFTTQAAHVPRQGADRFLIPRFCAVEAGSLRENLLRITGVWQTMF